MDLMWKKPTMAISLPRKLRIYPFVHTGSRVFSNVIRTLISSARKQQEEVSNNKDAPEAGAMEIDNKMQVITLLAEIRERDEFIGALTAQLKIKELEVNKLMEVIRREKLGML
ncbi:hypothetical protein CEXT_581031 [Caerostris extrusa]|uniref:Uncharacterized protein n=1 Tax=Caerostris extrusa TaxID=172846 RepID=A0AAV4X0R6_CAEEX|nr:hypothetical protein CEXT_581031 [Caerostris extrusa]